MLYLFQICMYITLLGMFCINFRASHGLPLRNLLPKSQKILRGTPQHGLLGPAVGEGVKHGAVARESGVEGYSPLVHQGCWDHGTKSLWWAGSHQSTVDLQKGPQSQNGPTSASNPMPIKIFFLGPFPTYNSLGCGSHSPIYHWSYPWSSL